jgi:DNA repair exonuclease SbcCD nuclease subunit
MKIAFTADWHIRSKHLQRLHRGPDFTAAARSAVGEAIKAGVVAILNGGDTFQDKRPTTTNIDDLMQIDQLLQEAQICMYTIDGNHDGADPSWLKTLFDPAVRDVMRGGIVDINNRQVNIISGEETVSVLGIPSCGAAEFKDYLETVAELDVASRPQIILWHGPIREMSGYPDPLTISIEDMPTHAFKAILCGDIHKRQFTTTGDGCLVGYPGATELKDKGEAFVKRSITIIDTSGPLYTESEVLIEHRPTYAYQIYSVEQLDEVIEKLRKLPKEPWPIVFVSYDAGVHPHVSERLYNALDNPLAILRAAATPKVQLPMFSLKAEGIELRRPEDFVAKFFPVPGATQDLAKALCKPSADHRDLLDRFTEDAISGVIQL